MDPGGEERIVISRAYHCETCHTFVRCEENECFSLNV